MFSELLALKSMKCVQNSYIRATERETEIKKEILGAILARYECEKHNRSG